MDILQGFEKGINLGGWISQYKRYLTHENHLQTFITREDIEQIAGWGFDHVRLPFDYDILEMETTPYQYREDGFACIDRCLTWCEQCGLNMVLDFHLAADQNIYPPSVPNPLFRNAPGSDRFLALWKVLAERYRDIGRRLIFDLLNEPIDLNSYLWIPFYQKAVATIRKADPSRGILIGGIDYSSVYALRELQILDDPLVAYTFHYYEPFQFTHQHAAWCSDIMPYKQDIQYPGEFTGLSTFLDSQPELAKRFGMFVWRKNDAAVVKELLQDAVNFKQVTNKALYCGEYGVIGIAPEDSKERYLEDLIALFGQCGIPHAFWNYKECDFGLLNYQNELIHPRLLKIITQ